MQNILITNDKDANQLINVIRNTPDNSWIVLDTETNGLTEDNSVVGLALYFPHTDTAYYVSVRHGYGNMHSVTPTPRDIQNNPSSMPVKLYYLTQYYQHNLTLNPIPNISQHIWDNIIQALNTCACKFLFHNALFDMAMLHKEGLQIPNPLFDTMTLVYLYVQDLGGGSGERSVFYYVDEQGERRQTNLSYRLKDLTDNLFLFYGYERKSDMPISQYPTAMQGYTDTHDAEQVMLKTIEAWFDEHEEPYSDFFHEHIGKRYKIPSPTNVAKVINTGSGKAEPDKVLMWSLPARDVYQYACNDVRLTYALHDTFKPILSSYYNSSNKRYISPYPIRERGEYDYSLYETWIWFSEINYALALMNRNGYGIEQQTLYDMMHEAQQTLQDMLDEAEAIAGFPIKLTRNNDLLDYLSDVLGERVTSVNKDFKEKYKDKHRIVALMDEYSKINKLKNTYLDVWAQYTVNDDGLRIIHPNHRITGTITGRLSSRNPNMQNVPRSGKPNVKTLLRSPVQNEYVVELDYATLEVRYAAWLFEYVMADAILGRPATIHDTTLYNLVVSGEDMHAYTANKAHLTEIFLGTDYTEDDIVKYLSDMGINAGDNAYDIFFKKVARQMAKIVNFASLYGGGATAIQKPLPVSYDEARRISNAWRAAYPLQAEGMNYISRVIRKPRLLINNKHHYIFYPNELLGIPLFWRNYNHVPKRRHMANGATYSPLDSQARKGSNSIVQGGSSMIMNETIRRMLSVKYPVRLLGTVHDSVLFAIPDDNHLLDTLKEIIYLATDYPTSPFMRVDIEIAPKDKGWGHKLSFAEWVQRENKPYTATAIDDYINDLERKHYQKLGVDINAHKAVAATYV